MVKVKALLNTNKEFLGALANLATIILTIVTIAYLKIQSHQNAQQVEIASAKFALENRPYIYIDSINWTGAPDHIFEINIENPSSYPSTMTLTFNIETKDGEEVFGDDVNNIILFPYEATKKISIGYRPITLILKSDPTKKFVINKKGADDLIDLFNSGQPFNLSLSASYSALVQVASFNNNSYTYSQKFVVQKDGDIVNIDAGKAVAD